MNINEATIRHLASGQSFERGEDYYHTGAVLGVEKRGDTLMAQVEGSDYEPYEVTVDLSEYEIEAWCSCPYDWGGYCKHIVAVLLTCIRQSEKIVERPPIEEMLAGVGEEKLREVLIDLLTERPRLVDWVENRLAIQASVAKTEQSGQPHQRQAPIDSDAFRRQAQNAMNSFDYRDYRRHESSNAIGEIQGLVEKARPFLEAGDGHSTLAILEPVTDVFVAGWHEIDYYGEDSAILFEELGKLFAEAILSADLSSQERKSLAQKMTQWQGELDNYGIDEGFDVAIAAAEQGWTYPPLQKAMQGHITRQGAWEGEPPWYADDLAVARLNVLERQGRTEEYLNLAEAEGQTSLYLTMLVKSDRGQEAVDYAMEYMATTDEALALVQALRNREQMAEAIKVAEHGLTLHGQKTVLARWLRDFMMLVPDQADVALGAAQAAFTETYSLEDYQAVEAVAGTAWPDIKPKLLDQLAQAEYASGRIDIYLHEGMVDEAVRRLDKERYIGYYILEPVVEAAWQSHPDWVIRQCKRQAEPIMDEGRSKHYHHAARWLEWMRRAYVGANRAEEWSAYLENLINKHARKYSLRPRLEGLRL